MSLLANKMDEGVGKSSWHTMNETKEYDDILAVWLNVTKEILKQKYVHDE